MVLNYLSQRRNSRLLINHMVLGGHPSLPFSVVKYVQFTSLFVAAVYIEIDGLSLRQGKKNCELIVWKSLIAYKKRCPASIREIS